MKSVTLHRDAIHPDPANIRQHFEGIAELASTIRQHGLQAPLLVRPYPGKMGHYLIIAGERRYRACLLARVEQIDCVIRRQPTPRLTTVQLMLIENDSRSAIQPMERARAYDELRAGGMSVSLIAQSLGKSEQTIRTYLDLMELDEATQGRIERKEIRWQDAQAAVREMRRRRSQYTSPAKTAAQAKKISFDPDTLTKAHPLAEQARTRCRLNEHHLTRRMVGGKHAIACGECWEMSIRADERLRVLSEIKEAGPATVSACEIEADPAIQDPASVSVAVEITEGAPDLSVLRTRFPDKPSRRERLLNSNGVSSSHG